MSQEQPPASPPAASQEQAPTVQAAPATKTPRTGVLVGGLALIMAVAAAIGAAYLWYSLLHEQRALFAGSVLERLAKLEGTAAETARALSTLEEGNARLRETQDVIKEALGRIEADVGQRRADWALVEAEQLMVIANHRLQLVRDIEAAVAALRAADRLLAQLPNPNLLPVRRVLARDIGALDARARADTAGIALRLGTLADEVGRLPLVSQIKTFEAAAPPPAEARRNDAGGWRRGAAQVWQDILGLVRIRHDAEIPQPLLPPEQQYFLRENLRLLLYGAQQALLHGNVPTYRHNVSAAAHWLREYFDLNTQVVAAALVELERLAEVRIATELPDVSGSLAALRAVTAKRPGS